MSGMDEHVVTLVAGRDGDLTADLVRAVADGIERAGGSDLRTVWLAEGRAADVVCRGLSVDRLRAVADEGVADRPIDRIVQPVATRRKKLLIADMESTIIEQEMLDELADVIGLRNTVADITRRAMNGELDFAAALKERVALLKGLPASILEQVVPRMTFMAGAPTLIATLVEHNVTCWLVSGGFTCFVAPVAQSLGFTEAYANVLILRDDKIAGEVVEPVLDKNTKKALLLRACEELGITLADSFAVGDGANDIPMLATSNEGGGLGVAYRAKPNVRAATPHQINHSDLTTLLYAQGYKRHDFVGA